MVVLRRSLTALTLLSGPTASEALRLRKSNPEGLDIIPSAPKSVASPSSSSEDELAPLPADFQFPVTPAEFRVDANTGQLLIKQDGKWDPVGDAKRAARKVAAGVKKAKKAAAEKIAKAKAAVVKQAAKAKKALAKQAAKVKNAAAKQVAKVKKAVAKQVAKAKELHGNAKAGVEDWLDGLRVPGAGGAGQQGPVEVQQGPVEVAVSAAALKDSSVTAKEAEAEADQDFGFMAGSDMPQICGVKELTSGQEEYLSQMHDSMAHSGVRKQLSTVFANPLKCWYGKMLYKDGCGNLEPQRTTSKDRHALQEKCRDPKVGFKALFSDASVTEAERQYLIKAYPTSKDLEGEPIEGAFSHVMSVLYEIGGKEVLCQTLELIDDGCKEVGPFTEY